MKYIVSISLAAAAILLICFIICQRQVIAYEDILETESALVNDLISLDSLDLLAIQANEKNKLRHLKDLEKIDSLNSICLSANHTQQLPDIYASEATTTIIKDTIVYKEKIKDTIIYKPKYVYVNDTVHKTIEVVDTIYKRYRQRRNN